MSFFTILAFFKFILETLKQISLETNEDLEFRLILEDCIKNLQNCVKQIENVFDDLLFSDLSISDLSISDLLVLDTEDFQLSRKQTSELNSFLLHLKKSLEKLHQCESVHDLTSFNKLIKTVTLVEKLLRTFDN